MTQNVVGFAKTSAGGVPLETSLTDGSDSQELKTDTSYSITSQSLGTFVEGATLTHLKVTAATGICYAGVLRNGQYIGVCQSLGSNALGGQSQELPIMPGPVRLVAGDQIIVRCQA
ncbi:MAG: hypothetical protein H8D82_00785 [Euryarchaeota archaeon]|nr:hypothetical protein [Euryarchaeota archaeon]